LGLHEKETRSENGAWYFVKEKYYAMESYNVREMVWYTNVPAS